MSVPYSFTVQLVLDVDVDGSRSLLVELFDVSGLFMGREHYSYPAGTPTLSVFQAGVAWANRFMLHKGRATI